MKSKSVMQFLFSMALLPICFGVLAQGELQRLIISDFAAVADTNVVSTEAIQAAIDSAYLSGGGIVVFPAGNYCAGTIILKENVKLFIDEGATLYASRNINDYRMPLKDAVRPVLIYANGADNIAILGKGKIDGRARRVYQELKEIDSFIKEITENARIAGVEMKQYYVVRPDVSLVNFVNCDSVRVEGVSLIESSWWSLHMVQCQDIEIKDVKINTSLEKGVNADGIDINSCRNVNISNCRVFTGDDAIVLKTRYEDPCENVVVKNCVLASSSTALKLGTESHGDFRNIRFENCQIENSNRGLSIVLREGGMAENVVFSNISIECSRRHFNWWGNADPILILVTKKSNQSKISSVRDVLFENIVATGMGTSRIESKVGQRIENIRFQNVSLSMKKENYLDKRADHALVISDARGVEINNLSIDWDTEKTEENWRSAVLVLNADDVRLNNFRGRQGIANSLTPAIDIENSSNVFISNYAVPNQVGVAVSVSGKTSENIFLENVSSQNYNSELLKVSDDVVNLNTIRIIQK